MKGTGHSSPEYMRAWRKKNAERIKEYERNYQRTPEQIARRREAARIYERLHREERREYLRVYRRVWERGEKRKSYIAKNRKRITARQVLWRKNHRTSHRSSRQKCEKRRWNQLTDSVLRAYLKQRFKTQPTSEQIKLCRQRIQLKRATKFAQLQQAAERLSKVLLN